jgi:hypothetical protein
VTGGFAILSPGRDLAWFVAPGIAAAIVGLAIGVLDPRSSGADAGLGLWIVGVLLVDVAHVWASLYRTYLDPQARMLHRKRLVWVPLLCAWFSFLLHLESPLLFWSVLAYVAIFHFIKQHVGFAMLYVRGGGESQLDRRIVEVAIWAGTLGPVIWWHANLPTSFAWFMDGDLFTGLPRVVGTVALALEVPVWIVFFVRRAMLRRQGHVAPMVGWLAIVPALNWHLGIVVFDDDRIFTITNVFLHGIPYLALVWVAGGRERVQARLGAIVRRPVGVPAVLVAFYGLLVALAVSEEALWDRLVWHDHPELFGASAPDPTASAVGTAAVVALLTVPQATHYVLDRFIWRAGPDNPRLAEQLGFSR